MQLAWRSGGREVSRDQQFEDVTVRLPVSLRGVREASSGVQRGNPEHYSVLMATG